MTLATAAGDFSPYRTAADFLAGALGDRAGATRALVEIERAMQASDRSHCRDWLAVADAHRQLLGDEQAAARCGAEARRRAKSGADWSDLARGLLDFGGEVQAARTCLERAEEQLVRDGELRELWDVANCWTHGRLTD